MYCMVFLSYLILSLCFLGGFLCNLVIAGVMD